MSLENFCRGTNMSPEQLAYHLDPHRPVSLEEKQHRFKEAFEVLFWRAVRIRDKANSYREFRVGCDTLAFMEHATFYPDRWKQFSGMNTKAAPTSRPICAEQVAISTAYAAGYSEIIGMVIVGMPQEDENRHRHSTLRPCAECRKFMASHPLIRPHTRIVTMTPPVSGVDVESSVWNEFTFQIREEFSFQTLLQEYGESP